ncbi:SUMF1/EgtB/PvdO family nonheme iron enzyme [Streptomyces sp. NBC_01803]|uniref:SUMF1/EgtB/PvdO family nonheme iron enzyme n=1 Tax=Streptomyces sp. NBC_01803 TaxID=2975946 RepID=UPI003FA34A39
MTGRRRRVPGRDRGHGHSGTELPPLAVGTRPARRPERAQVTLPGGVFTLGDHFREVYHADAEGPVREVRVAPFRIDTTAVTNADFAAFADATGYVTDAERFGNSFVFHLVLAPGAALLQPAATFGEPGRAELTPPAEEPARLFPVPTGTSASGSASPAPSPSLSAAVRTSA